MLFAVLLSLHLVNVFYYLFMSIPFSSSCMPEQKFAFYHKAAEVCPHRQKASLVLPLVYGQLTKASVQTPSQPFSGWMTKPALPVLRPGIATHTVRSVIYITTRRTTR